MEKIYPFKLFYPYYLSQHQNLINRRLHCLGTSLALLSAVCFVLYNQLKLLIFIPIIAYGFAWTGHFFFEKNRPATFSQPFYSLWGDFVMLKDYILGNISR